MMVSQKVLNDIVEDLQKNANNNKEREVYLDLHPYDMKISGEITDYILEYLKTNNFIEKGVKDGKGLIRCIVCEF